MELIRIVEDSNSQQQVVNEVKVGIGLLVKCYDERMGILQCI